MNKDLENVRSPAKSKSPQRNEEEPSQITDSNTLDLSNMNKSGL